MGNHQDHALVVFEKLSGPFLGSTRTWQGLNSNPIQFCFVFLLSLFHLENRVCLSHGVQVAGAAWRAVTRTMAGVGDLVQRIGDGRTCQVLGGRAVERSSGAVCGLHHSRGDEEHGFLG
jgi:hypothetical protein